uniref:Wsv414-like protein n=1 Tax=Trachysalambria curvirostris nimavirus TaxID=2984282 RepID=A0A9C7BIS4_9VIRU|nr:MAG: wsv414-like protein [Trachysalambria curvirostris nimavirus]
MSSASSLPFSRQGGTSATTGSTMSAEDLSGAMSVARLGLLFITIISITILVMCMMNLKLGHKKATESEPNRENTETTQKDSAYPNKTRDYSILIATILSICIAIPTIMTTYPKKTSVRN